MNNLFTFVPVADIRRALKPNQITSKAGRFEDLVRDWIGDSRSLHFERERIETCAYVSVSFREDEETLGKACLHIATAMELCPEFAPLNETLVVSPSFPLNTHPWIKKRNRRLGIHGLRAPSARFSELALSYALSSAGSARVSLLTAERRFVRLDLKYSGKACSWSERFLLVKDRIGMPEHGRRTDGISRHLCRRTP